MEGGGDEFFTGGPAAAAPQDDFGQPQPEDAAVSGPARGRNLILLKAPPR